MKANETGFPEHLGLPDEFRFRRFLELRHLPTRAPGHCVWCDAEVPKRRKTWCSAKCVKEYQVRAWGAVVARQVFRRDKGVCAHCGIDTVEIKALYDQTQRLLRESVDRRLAWRTRCEADGLCWGPWRQRGFRYRLWEADHIVPVVNGGGCCGLENYQTLCVRCHKAETAMLARRRAEERNPQLTKQGDLI